MAEYNPFDPTTTRRTTRYAQTFPTALPQTQTVDTGIPGSYTPPEEGGFTGGVPPGGSTTPPATTQTQTQSQPAAPSYAQYAMPGWEQSKWEDTTHQTPKYQVGRILSQYPHTPAGAQQAMAEIQKVYPNATFDGKDILTIPGVGSWDIITGADLGGQGWSWQTLTDENGNPLSSGSAVAPAATATASGGSSYSSSGGGMGGGAYGDAIRQKIMALMGQSPTDISTNPTYQGAIRAYDVEAQRAAERERNAIAERMAAEGTNQTGAFDDRVLAAEQARGENTASFAGNLAIRELERQRDEIMQALTIGAGLLTEEQRIALSEKLGLINANLQQQSITNQNNQYNQSLGWNQATWEYGANQGWWQ